MCVSPADNPFKHYLYFGAKESDHKYVVGVTQ